MTCIRGGGSMVRRLGILGSGDMSEPTRTVAGRNSAQECLGPSITLRCRRIVSTSFGMLFPVRRREHQLSSTYAIGRLRKCGCPAVIVVHCPVSTVSTLSRHLRTSARDRVIAIHVYQCRPVISKKLGKSWCSWSSSSHLLGNVLDCRKWEVDSISLPPHLRVAPLVWLSTRCPVESQSTGPTGFQPGTGAKEPPRAACNETSHN